MVGENRTGGPVEIYLRDVRSNAHVIPEHELDVTPGASQLGDVNIELTGKILLVGIYTDEPDCDSLRGLYCDSKRKRASGHCRTYQTLHTLSL